MNEVSIIINGVRYDAVKPDCPHREICIKCDLERLCDDSPAIADLCIEFCSGDEDLHFKKSTKSFER